MYVYIYYVLGAFLISPLENLQLGFTPESFENSAFSPVSQAFPTRVLRQGVLSPS